MQHLASQGRAVVIGVGGGAALELDLRLLMGRRGRLFASNLRSRSREQKAQVIAALGARALPLLAGGRLRVPVSETFALSDAAAAYDCFAAGGKLGKVVLVA